MSIPLPPAGFPKPSGDDETSPVTHEADGEEVLDEDANDELVDSAAADRLASSSDAGADSDS